MSDAILSPSTKQCSKCKIVKPLRDFNKSKAHKLGVHSYCRACMNALSAERYIVHREKYIKRASDRVKANPEQKRAYQIANPLKQKAKSAADYALRLGKIIRMPCEVCGEVRVDMHHNDYSKPLDVRFLCRRHHMLWHSQNGPGLNG